MEKKLSKNPNTIECLNTFYRKLKRERFNAWMMKDLLSILPKKKKDSILDVGCGLGRTLFELKQYTKANLVGIDISDVAIMKARSHYKDRGVEFYCKNVEELKDKNTWDLIICSQTLEHVDNPKLIIENIKRAVKVGGYLFITVPYPKSILDSCKMHYWRFYKKDFELLYYIDLLLG